MAEAELNAGNSTSEANAAATDAGNAGTPATAEGAAPKDGGKADTQPKTEAGKAEEAGKPQQAPEAYKYELPEGVQVDEAMKGEFDGLAKELGLPQEAHGKLVGMATKLVQSIQGNLTEALTKQQEKWLTDTKADKELGGNNLDSVVKATAPVMERFGTPELKQVLEDTGLGNHPEVIRLFWRFSKELKAQEGSTHAGNSGGSVQKSDADVLFGNTPQKSVS